MPTDPADEFKYASVEIFKDVIDLDDLIKARVGKGRAELFLKRLSLQDRLENGKHASINKCAMSSSSESVVACLMCSHQNGKRRAQRAQRLLW